MSLPVENPVKSGKIGKFVAPTRLLLGPGPQNAHPRVHAAMSLPQVGHMDPDFLAIFEDTKHLLRYVWQTNNTFTIPVSGTGSAAWEAAVANLTEPGDVHLICVNGYFGERALDLHSRYGADLKSIHKPYGEIFTVQEIKTALETYKPKLLWICHAETSTGVLQPMEEIGGLCRAHDCLLLADTVTSICGVETLVDEWQIDACYAGTQKCMGCPPGVAPLTLGPRALKKIADRKQKVANWYLDMTMIQKYIEAPAGAPRVYHHTVPISMIFAIREALQIVAEEGLSETWKRHRETAEYFWEQMERMGLECLVAKEHRLPSLTTVKVPEGVDGMAVIAYMRTKFNTEIGGALGELKGKVWRIGLMGYNSRREIACFCIAGLQEALEAQGWKAGQ